MMFDVAVFHVINGFAGRWDWLDNVGIFCAEYLGNVLLATLAILLVVDYKKHWRMVLQAVLAAIIVRFVLVQAFYVLHFKFRPFVNNNIHLLIPYDAHQTAFPSGHASFYFALSTIIYGYHKKLGIVFYIASGCIVVARIFVGVHWPSDVIAGILVGILMGWALNRLFKKVIH